MYVFASWNWLVQFNAGQNCEIMWAVTASTITMIAEPEDLITPHPAIPSLVVSCTQV